MKKSLMLLLSGSLCFTCSQLIAADLIEAVTTNFGPKRPAGQVAPAETQPAPVKPAPAPQPAPVAVPFPQPPPPAAAPAPVPAPQPQAKPATPPPPPPAPVAQPQSTPAPVTVETPMSPEIERAASEELVRLQEAQLAARNLINQGQAAYDAGKYEDAAAKFQAALKTLPQAPATDQDRNEAIDGLVRTYYRLADDALQKGDNAKARDFAKKALEYDPSNRAAASIFGRAERAEHEAKARAAAEKAEEPRPDRTDEFVAKKDEVKRLFREGKILMNSGQYDDAEKSFKQILIIDPYNTDAYQFLGDLNRRRLAMATAGAAASRNERLWEVTKGWLPPINITREGLKHQEGGGPIESAMASKAKILDKLNTIVLKEINFRDADIRDVVSFLSDESRRLDAEGVGVNIIIQLGETGGAPAPTPVATPFASPAAGQGMMPPSSVPIEGQPVTPASPVAPPPVETAPAVTPATAPRISLTLRNIPLIEALKYVTTSAGLKFRVESHAVLVLPKDAPEGDLVTRTYRVESGAFIRAISTTGEKKEVSGSEEFRALGSSGVSISTEGPDVLKFFKEAGVVFPPGSSLLFNQPTSTIIVKNTPQNLEDFEKVLDAINVIPKQVEIQAKFVDISQSDLDSLGFQWQVGQYMFGSFDTQGGSSSTPFPPGSSGTAPGTPFNISGGLRNNTAIAGDAVEALLGSSAATTPNNVATLRGILTNPQFQVTMQALAQKTSTDVLSAPEVTTTSGNAAQIRVVQEFIYPTEYATPAVSSSAITPAIPSSFKTREVGVILNVTPQVGADGYTINLTLIPEVSQFLGFIDYSPGQSVAFINNTSNTGASGATGVLTAQNIVKQPLFASRSIATSVVIWDGQTVVLGGLITENVTKLDDKIPFLGDIPFVGRLFRSKVTSRSKRNLLVFVTANLIDPAGNRIHQPEPVKVLAK